MIRSPVVENFVLFGVYATIIFPLIVLPRGWFEFRRLGVFPQFDLMPVDVDFVGGYLALLFGSLYFQLE